MSNSVDSRVVTMKFENSAFERAVSTTLGTLQKLKSSLDFKTSNSAAKSINDLAGATKRFDMGHVGATIEGVNGKLVAMGTIGVTALATIANKAIEVGANMARNLTSAMSDGFSDYELKVGATQTIMAGTGENIGSVTKYLKELDTYADQTIYSLSDMTSNIGKFTNAGVKLPVAVNAMKGIANVAALSGANSQEAARAMYNLGQAIGQGSVKLMDWKSVELANMGTKEFKEQLIDAAVAAGTLTKGQDGLIRTSKGTEVNFKNFSTTLSEGWLTSKALTDTLGAYADETTTIGKKAYAAAKDVKTFSMMMETTKAAAGTGWTDTFEIVLGTLPEATKMWTGLSNVIGGIIGRSADARNKMLGDWKKGGGRDTLLEGIKAGWEALLSIVKPIREAFRQIFPAKTGQDLIRMTEGFKNLMERMKIGEGTAQALRRSFAGFFAIFSIARQVISAVLGYLFDFFGLVSGGNGGLLNITASIGDILVALDAWLKKSGALTAFFDALSAAREAIFGPIIQVIGTLANAMGGLFVEGLDGSLAGIAAAFALMGPAGEAAGVAITWSIGLIREAVVGLLDMLGPLGDKLASVFTGFDVGQAKKNIDSVKKEIGPLDGVVAKVGRTWDKVVNAFRGVKEFLSPVFAILKAIFANVGDKITNFVKDLKVTDALALINTGFFIAFYRAAKKFFDNLSNVTDSIAGTFNQLTDNLKTMQQDVKANIVVKIAAAILMLVGALVLLAGIKPEKLAIGLAAIGTMLVGMTKTLGALEFEENSGKGMKDAAQMVVMATAMGIIAGAMLVMAGALAILGNMDVSTLIKGTTAVTVVLGVFAALGVALGKFGGGAPVMAAAASIFIISNAMIILAGAIGLFAAMKWETILKGMGAITLSLVAISFAMNKMPGGMVQTAAGLLIVAVALNILAGALRILGGMSVPEMAKSLIMLGGALAILWVAMMGMNALGPAAIAMAAVGAALLPMAMGLRILGKLSLKEIGKALLALVGVFTVFGVAALILAPVAPVLLTLAGAIALLGVGLLAVGAGMWLFATGLAILAASGAAGAAILMGIITGILEMIPLLAEQFGLGLIAIAKVLGDAGPPLVEALAKIIISLLDALIEVAPKIADALIVLMRELLRILVESAPDWLDAVVDLMVAVIDGMARGVPRIIRQTTLMIIAILKELTRNLPLLVQAGWDLVIGVIDGIAQSMNDNKNIERLMGATRNLGLAFARGIINGILDMLGPVGWVIRKVGGGMMDALEGALDIHSPSRKTYWVAGMFMAGITGGIRDNMSSVERSAAEVGDVAVDALGNTMKRISDMMPDLDMSPTITPVLDLTQLTAAANTMEGIMPTISTNATVSYAQAADISSTRQAQDEQSASESEDYGPREVKFEQNINAPMAPDPVTVYRNTKNLLSLAEEALT